MLKSWTPGEEPDKDEMKVQLEKTRNRLYDLQMKIKEHKLPVPKRMISESTKKDGRL